MVKETKGLHSFSIEVNHSNCVKEISIRDGDTRALIEGELGDHINIEIVEGFLLQITGDRGIFRLDLNEGDQDKISYAL